MSIEIIKPGLYTTIQDKGRFEFQNQGVPVSGFMDVYSAQLANTLVTNNPNLALFEMTMVGIEFKAIESITIAITGANMEPKLNGKSISMNKAIVITKNDIVSFKAVVNGVYTYLAVFGGIKIPNVLNSKSTYAPAKLGGFKGRPLKKGDVIKVSHQNLKPINSKVKVSEFSSNIILDCLKGPEWNCFSEKDKISFFDTVFTINKDCNRIGIRLDGDKVNLPKKDEIISSGIVKGTVQITKAGQPIVMMADAPTTGGYLRLINLTEHSCNQLSQVKIGGKITFKLL